MGLRSSALCCQRVTNAVKHIMESDGFNLVSYLDDMASAESWERAQEAFDHLGTVLGKMGLEESTSKACAPSSFMTFLGVQFDTINMTLSVTQERIEEAMALLAEWEQKSTVTKKEVQSIVGKLNFMDACVRPGRLFISRI